ncbi:MAG: hypothetical protein JNM14_13470 [Ferruginibacter sp.]|nr:hypothetical protein [Ferruginibacter sp.]
MIISANKYKTPLLACLSAVFFFTARSQTLPGFTATGVFDEQELTISDQWKDVILNINAPLQLKQTGKTYLVFFALPNGNSIEWTKGKKLKEGDDWHFDIQHIAAQTRYVRQTDKKNNYIIVYTMAAKKSWPAWKRSTRDSIFIIKNIVDSISRLFKKYRPETVLNGHSGGGSFIFGYLDAVENIPAGITRIAFLDSDYGYEEAKHAIKLVNWLKAGHRNKLLVLAYNDSIVVYNGKPLVSTTGGTWYRSRLMQKNLAAAFDFDTVADTAFIHHSALNKRIQIILKENPSGLLYHTEQVARNGFMLSLLSATKFDRKKYFTYFGQRVYQKFISD